MTAMRTFALQESRDDWVTVPEQVVLDSELSALSRLAYVVLTTLAGTELRTGALAEAPALLGLDGADALAPLLDELVDYGVLSCLVHRGSSEPVFKLHRARLAADDPARSCDECLTCRGCACRLSYKAARQTECGRCRTRRQAYARAEQDIARWQADLDRGCTYAHGHAGRLLHRWDCATLNSVDKSREALETSLEQWGLGEDDPYGDGFGYDWPALPQLFTAEELRAKPTRRRSCQSCKPDPV